jgi:hypothetical protein
MHGRTSFVFALEVDRVGLNISFIVEYWRCDMCFEWMNKVVKKMKWYDISLIKLAVFFATLLLITAWPAFLELVMRFEWYWYLILTVIVAIPVWKKML